MRKPDTAAVTAAKQNLAAGGSGDASAELVCLALALAVIALATRIASIW
jgi:hypothetical protein